MQLLICSDIHYASDAEKQRRDYELAVIQRPLPRLLVRLYRHHLWLRDPFAHNALLDHVLNPPLEPGLAIANGDYSCDSAFIGLADEPSCQSARECLGKLRQRFPSRLRAVLGDHELGKTSLCGRQGGLRLQSFHVAQTQLGLEPLWTERIGRYLLLGITSTLAALPVYEPETLEAERPQWREIARDHCAAIAAAFAQLHPRDRVLLFCHDPTALPFLWQIDALRQRAAQIERTIIGHLHSELILKPTRLLSWMPKITRCGPAAARITAALSKTKTWAPFHILLCPSLSGLELNRRGGFYTATLDPDARHPAQFSLHVVQR